MKFHIVGNGESIKDILDGYEITIEELKNENKHIRNWNYLIPGTKLKIPVLTEALVEELNEIEPFIEDYYPKIKLPEEEYSLIDEQQYFEEIVDANENNEVKEQEENIVEENEKLINEIQEVNEEQIEKQIESISQENKNINRNETPILIRYVYPQQYYYNGYYRPIIYVVPRK